LAALNWLLEAGADEAVSEVPIDRFSARATPALAPSAQHQPRPAARPNLPLAQIKPTTLAPLASDGFGSAMEIAGGCGSLSDLKKAMERFEGSQLKKLATNTVFADGNPNGGIMLIGEAPGYDEDKAGLPFVGRAGKLLDKMLAAAGLAERVFITNTVFWRPPGNRTPTALEQLVCAPFLERAIALVQPRQLLLVGGASAKAMLKTEEGILSLRGRWFEWRSADGAIEIPALPTLHPAFLLRQPAAKKRAWIDLLTFTERLDRPERSA